MKRLAIVVALTGSGCAHHQLTNHQVAYVAFWGGFYLALFTALVLWCHDGCNTK